ncbi:MAG: hypothetical protein ABT00_08415 [Bordetella sp. SCN 68-11]|nr:MAG: hypothetical protein ABT00_08415 [Bordetella sp. SCN 68-11]OJY74271.1 MAG: hypothetical protein BGP12_19865 [Rhodospirillales bacterium 70-18]
MFACARWSAHAMVGAVAFVIVWLTPPRLAYAVTWRILMIAYPVFALPYGLVCPPNRRRDWRALVLQRALSVMTRQRPGFDLRLRVEGGEALLAARRETGRVVLATAHFGMTLASARVMADLGVPMAMIADRAGGWDGWHWSLTSRINVLQEGPGVLLRARPLIAGGTAVVCYADYILAGRGRGARVMGLSPSLFHLARHLGAAVLFLGARLERDGTIVITFHRPAVALIASDAELEACTTAFTAFVEGYTGWTCVVRKPPPRRRRRDGAAPTVDMPRFAVRLGRIEDVGEETDDTARPGRFAA